MTLDQARAILRHPELFIIGSIPEAEAVFTLIDAKELPLAALFWPDPLHPPVEVRIDHQ